jgi:sugar lactone lactonase YvrE
VRSPFPDLKPGVFIDEAFALGEGPFWFRDHLWWVDIDAGALHCSDAAGRNRSSRQIGRCLGAAAPVDGQTFVVAMEDGLGFLDWASGSVTLLGAPEQDRPDNRFNDGKCDPVGRFVAGTLNRSGMHGAASLYSLDDRREIRKLYAPVTLSNGLAWSADGRTFYHVDSRLREIAAFDYDLESGLIANRRVVIEVPDGLGLPDGMDIDKDGNLWVAHWGGAAVRCWSPVTGQCLGQISTPCSTPTSCCFGGSDGSTLFITTARPAEMSPAEDRWAGRIFSVELPTRGSPARTFAGSALQHSPTQVQVILS